jgi:hypothetical protein
MRYLFLLLCLCARGDWRTNQVFYWLTDHPSVAITSTNILNIQHASGSITSAQIGDQTGVLSGLCTGFISDGVCGGSIQNCTWGHQYNNVTNDAYLFLTCRPVTNGITYVVTNATVGMGVSWFSIITRQWYTGQVTLTQSPFPYTFPDGMVANYGTVTFDGPVSVAGDSGSPVFDQLGSLIGALAARDTTSFPGTTNNVAYYLWPSGVKTRPLSSGVNGLADLFNSDPDR